MLIIFCGLYSYFFNVRDYTVIAGIIAFFGAIIGGYLTWSGVKYNLEHQREKDRYEKLPSEIKNCWKLNKYLSFGYFLPTLIKGKSKQEIWIKINDFYSTTEDTATEIALDISPEMYKVVMNYYTLLTDYFSYLNKDDLEMFNEKMKEIYDRSQLVLQNYENEYEELSRKFKTKM